MFYAGPDALTTLLQVISAPEVVELGADVEPGHGTGGAHRA